MKEVRIVDEFGIESWYMGGNLHREGGSAYRNKHEQV